VNNGKSVAIVAMGRSCADYVKEAAFLHSRHQIADETWAINAMGDVIQHDRLFVMDDLRVFVKRMEESGKTWYTNWMMTHDKPIYTSVDYPEFPSSCVYPLAFVVNNLNNPEYYNSTVAYTLALAIAEGFKEIKLYGADFTYEDTHLAESGRGCVEFLMGIAHARGIRMEVARSSTLLDTTVPKDRKLYGYIKQPKLGWDEANKQYSVVPSGGVEYEDIKKVDFEHGRFVLKEVA